MRRALLIALIATLAACGTPQERCIRTATKDLRVVNSLIAEIQANLQRGYGYETYQTTITSWEVCEVRPATTEGGKPRVRYCLEDDIVTTRRRVAIDPEAERRKLQGLVVKQRELNARAAAEIAACKQQFPE